MRYLIEEEGQFCTHSCQRSANLRRARIERERELFPIHEITERFDAQRDMLVDTEFDAAPRDECW